MELVHEIEKLPRFSPQRAALYSSMHALRKAALATDPKIAHWREQFQQARRRADEDATLFDRELFYALQPSERLEQMIEKYHVAFG